MNIIEQIKAEIERLYNGESPEHDPQCDFCDGYLAALSRMDEFLDTIEEKSEKPMNKEGLENEAVSYCFDNGLNLSPRVATDFARHFAKWGAEHASGSSEIPKDLLDAQVEIVEKLIGENNNDGANAAHPFACEYVVELLQKAVSAGAKWQKEQYHFFNKAWTENMQAELDRNYENGKQAMKEQMMKGAVEYEVGMHGEPIKITFDKYVQRARGIFPRDKVSVIIIKKEDDK